MVKEAQNRLPYLLILFCKKYDIPAYRNNFLLGIEEVVGYF